MKGGVLMIKTSFHSHVPQYAMESNSSHCLANLENIFYFFLFEEL